MSEGGLVGAPVGIAARPGAGTRARPAPALLVSLTVCLPLIFVIGAFTLFATRFIYWLYHPEEWVGTSPSISGTASVPPASVFFMAMMLAAAVCIVMSWSLAWGMYAARLRLVRPANGRTRLAVLSGAACVAGIVAGLSLGTLAVVSLQISHDVHIFASYVFFTSQILAFLLEGAAAVALRRVCPGLDEPVERRAVRGKLIIGVTTFGCALFFLFLYHVRDYLAPATLYPVQQLYVATEYTLSLMCFAYPLTSFHEVRRHYRLAMATPAPGRPRRG